MAVQITDDPVVLSRRLRTGLKKMRAARHESVTQVADALDWSHSKVVRIEMGDVRVSVTDVKALLNHYGVDAPETIDEYARMARISRRQPYTEFRDVLSKELIRFFQLQERANTVREFELTVVPGVLQTEEYARAILRPFEAGDDALTARHKRMVQARMERQQALLDSPAPPHLSILLDESVILRPIGTAPGDAEIMRNQLEFLKDLSRRDFIDIQVIPFAAGAHAGLGGPFVVLEFDGDEDEDVLYLEGAGDLVSRGDNEEIQRYLGYFYDLTKVATPAAAFAEQADRAIETFSGRRTA